MKTLRIAALLLVATCLATGAARSQSGDCPCPPAAESDNGGDPVKASVSYFHEQLSPYGRWVAREGYGEVWVPYVASGWRPYTTGHWVYTDQGWAWVADESWGWAPFHYGRWYYESGFGWGWVPGTVWAPAWVAWRHGGGYVGWAALPPAVGFSVGVGVSFGGVNLDVAIAPSYYSFVGEGAILTPRLSTVIVASARNTTIISNTTNITNYTVVNNRVVNNGVSVQRIEQVTGHPVTRVSTAGQVGLYQPPVFARAARATKVESFTNRAAGTAAGSGVQTGAQTKSAIRTTGTTGTAGTAATTGVGLHGRGATGTTGISTGTSAQTKSARTSRSHSTGTGGTSSTGAGTTGATGSHSRTSSRHPTTGSGTQGQTNSTTGTGSTGSHNRSGTRHPTTGSGTQGQSTGTGGHGQPGSAGMPHQAPPHHSTGGGPPSSGQHPPPRPTGGKEHSTGTGL
jgi:hypothetical protein